MAEETEASTQELHRTEAPNGVMTATVPAVDATRTAVTAQEREGVRGVLEITSYEPPASGWTMRVKLIRRVLRERGFDCQILDVGPSRKLERPDCLCVNGAADYLAKVVRFARLRYSLHGHVNAEYFRGILLALAAAAVARVLRTRYVLTFHAGLDQPFLKGWKRTALAPVYRLLMSLSADVICNDHATKKKLALYARRSKIHPIPAFSRQYLDFQQSSLDPALESFIRDRSPVVSTYLCFRPGFFTDVLIAAIPDLRRKHPEIGLVIVGTGSGELSFRRKLERHGVTDAVHLAGDLTHDQLMTLICRSELHLRTHVRDGVSATVLEALSVGTPVVASDNGTRPESVVTYPADDSQALSAAVARTLARLDDAVASIVPPRVNDTAGAEVRMLLGESAASAAKSA